MSSLSLEESRARLKNHFAGEKVREASRWEELWNAGDFLPWDRHAPNPALTDILTDRADLIGPSVVPNQDGSMRRKRALVPGCGRGYDVLLLASFGYDAYGLEVSETAVQRCWQEQSENGSKYAVRDQTIGAGKVNFIQGDFFAIEWLAQVGGDGWIDLIYDYTVQYPASTLLLQGRICFRVADHAIPSSFQSFHPIQGLAGRSGCRSYWLTTAV